MNSTEQLAAREAFAEALAGFKSAASALDARWTSGINSGALDGAAVIGYPSWMPSFDEATAEIVRMQVKPIRDAHSAMAILTEGGHGALTFPHCSVEYIGCSDACRVDLDGEAWIWVTEDLGGHDGGWQACLYLDADHEGYYLPNAPAPMGPQALRENVAALIAVRDQVALNYDALYGIEPFTGMQVVLREGGMLCGTLSRTFEPSAGDRSFGLVVYKRGVVEINLCDVRRIEVVG